MKHWGEKLMLAHQILNMHFADKEHHERIGNEARQAEPMVLESSPPAQESSEK